MPDSSSAGMALRALIGSVAQHAAGLFSLASWEGREAGAHYFRLLIVFLSAAFFLFVSYLFLLLFAIFFLSHWLEANWMWITLGVAVIHGIAAVIGIWIFVRTVGKPMFSSTISEIKKDLETLHSSSN